MKKQQLEDPRTSEEILPHEGRITEEMTTDMIAEKLQKSSNEEIAEGVLRPYARALDAAERECNFIKRKFAENGLQLIEQPVVPKYLGFEEEQEYEEVELSDVQRVYVKGEWRLWRVEDVWTLSDPEAETTDFKADNMYVAITIMKGLGAPVSMEELAENGEGHLLDIDKIRAEAKQLDSKKKDSNLLES